MYILCECLLATQLREMPWLRFLTSGPVWAIIIANLCMDWGGYTLLTSIPTFYREVLLFDIEAVSKRSQLSINQSINHITARQTRQILPTAALPFLLRD